MINLLQEKGSHCEVTDGGDHFLITIRGDKEKADTFDFLNLNNLIDEFRINRTDIKPENSYFFSNGFQSWSVSKEYKFSESFTKLSLLRQFNTFILREKTETSNRKQYLYSNFFTYFRFNSKYIALFALNEETPPVVIYFNKKSFVISLNFLYNNPEDLHENLLGRFILFSADDYFNFKEKIKKFYSHYCNLPKFPELGRLNHLFGWESWYKHYSDINENMIIGNLNSADKTQNLLKLKSDEDGGSKEIFQVDDGWEKQVGQWDCNQEKFPSGMKAIAGKIKAKGMIPGIWIAPFLITRYSSIFKEKPRWVLRNKKGKPIVAGFIPNWGNNFYTLDISRDDVVQYLLRIFDKIINEWGFEFLKLDFLYAGMLEGCFAGGKSAFYWYDQFMKKITKFNVLYLGCGVPIESGYKYFPINRIGADVKEKWEYNLLKILRHQGRPSAYTSLVNVINMAFLDKTLTLNDPDVFFTRRDDNYLTLCQMELIALVNFCFGTLMMISDDLDNDINLDIDFTRRMLKIFSDLKREEFGFYTIDNNIFIIFSKSKKYFGIVNLRMGNYSISEKKLINRLNDLDIMIRGDEIKSRIEKAYISNCKLDSNSVIKVGKTSISIF